VAGWSSRKAGNPCGQHANSGGGAALFADCRVDAEAASLHAIRGVCDEFLPIKALRVAAQSGDSGGFDLEPSKHGVLFADFPAIAQQGDAPCTRSKSRAERDDRGEPAAEWRRGRGRSLMRLVGVVGAVVEAMGSVEVYLSLSTIA